MTLDEAIKHAEDVANKCETDTDWGMGNDLIDRSGVADVIECGKEHRQLAEWLKDYKKKEEINQDLWAENESLLAQIEELKAQMNNMIYICSPYRGEVERNKQYARELTRLALENGFCPVTVHLYLTEATDDNNPIERELGMSVGMEILDHCKYILVGERYGISEGMAKEIKKALKTEKVFITPDGRYSLEQKSSQYMQEKLKEYSEKRPEETNTDTRSETDYGEQNKD